MSTPPEPQRYWAIRRGKDGPGVHLDYYQVRFLVMDIVRNTHMSDHYVRYLGKTLREDLMEFRDESYL